VRCAQMKASAYASPSPAHAVEEGRAYGGCPLPLSHIFVGLLFQHSPHLESLRRACRCAESKPAPRVHTEKQTHLIVFWIVHAHIIRFDSPISVAIVEGDVVGPVLVALVDGARKELGQDAPCSSASCLLHACHKELAERQDAQQTALATAHATPTLSQRNQTSRVQLQAQGSCCPSPAGAGQLPNSNCPASAPGQLQALVQPATALRLEPCAFFCPAAPALRHASRRAR